MEATFSQKLLAHELTLAHPTHDAQKLARSLNSAPKGDDYDEVRATLAVFGFTAHIHARGEEAQVLKRQAGVRARRWVVERTHSWMNRFRRILIRWDKKAANSLAFLHFACALIAFRAAGLCG